jgi:hypothetical protein
VVDAKSELSTIHDEKKLMMCESESIVIVYSGGAWREK